MHYTEIIAGELVTALTPSTLAKLLAAARTAGEVAIVIGTHSGRVSSVHASPITRTIAKTGFVACGPVCWIRTDATPYLAFVSVHAWGHWLGTHPETIREFIAAGRMLPVVGKHIGDIDANEIAMAQAYAIVRGYDGVELDISPDGYLSGAHIVQGVYIRELETTVTGVTCGVDACSYSVILRMQLAVLAAELAAAQGAQS